MKSETYKKESAFQRLRNNLKGLPFEQKIEHILRYYWGTILLVILVPIVLFMIVLPMFKSSPDVVFSGNCCNVTLTDEGQSYLINDWNACLDMEPGTLGLHLDFSTTAGRNIETEADGGIQILAEISADRLDYVLCDSVAMEFFAVQRGFIPLDMVLDDETLFQWSENIYYFTDEEDGTVYAAGLNISQLPFVQACVPQETPVYFMFANKAEPDLERLQQFFDFLSAWSEQQN